MNELLLGYYGDDFTGSTDALESLSAAGVRSVLFLTPPTPEQLNRLAGVQAVGIAGRTRSLPTDAIDAEIRPALRALRSLGPAHVHYKVCSTFDSSPTIGNIGRVIDVALDEFDCPFVPLLIGAPPLGRYCVFGNLFARAGVGSRGSIYRLDRHPSMSQHPVTPADESDLRLHLSRQTDIEMQLFDILALELPVEEARAVLRGLLGDRRQLVLFDVLHAEQLRTIGQLIDEYARPARPLFSVGSSGVEMALAAHWAAAGRLPAVRGWATPESVRRLLVVSGSCSPVTASQIEWAVEHGFAEVVVDSVALADPRRVQQQIARTTSEIVDHLQADQAVVVHTGKGTQDPRVAATREFLARRGRDEITVKTESGRLLGNALGQIVRECLEQTSIERCCIAGGDTSSSITRALEIQSLVMLAPMAPGAPLCRVTAAGSPADGLEMNFKGGQVGEACYFGMLARGQP